MEVVFNEKENGFLRKARAVFNCVSVPMSIKMSFSLKVRSGDGLTINSSFLFIAIIVAPVLDLKLSPFKVNPIKGLFF